MAIIDNYKGFFNLLFGVLLAIIGYLLVDRLEQIDDSLKEITKLQQMQLIRNENFELRITSVEKVSEENKKKIDNHLNGKK